LTVYIPNLELGANVPKLVEEAHKSACVLSKHKKSMVESGVGNSCNIAVVIKPHAHNIAKSDLGEDLINAVKHVEEVHSVVRDELKPQRKLVGNPVAASVKLESATSSLVL